MTFSKPVKKIKFYNCLVLNLAGGLTKWDSTIGWFIKYSPVARVDVR